MPYSQQHLALIGEHLRKHLRRCSVCGGSHFVAGELVATDLIHPVDRSVVKPPAAGVFPLLPAICATCSHVYFFAWMGILPKEG